MIEAERSAIEDPDEVDYVRLGWYVFPTVGKIPFRGSHGARDATVNEALVRRIWNERPDACISVATHPSRLVAIDVDAHRGGEETAARVLAGESPPHPVMTTPHGGRRLLFRAPVLSQIETRVDGLGAGIDVLASGSGCFVAPPSPGYRWWISPLLTATPHLPLWLWKILPRRAAERTPSRRTGAARTLRFTLDDVLPRLERCRGSARTGWTACCPAHDDRHPSFSITEGADGQPLFHCFSGCSPAAIIAALEGLAGRKRGAA